MFNRSSERLAELDAMAEWFGHEPPDGSIIRLTRDLNGHRYHYAVIRGGDLWFASGARSGRALEGLSWDDLTDWMAEFDIVHYDVIGPPEEFTPPRPRGTSASHQDQDHEGGIYLD